MVRTEVTSCKLPLLDGEDAAENRIIMTELELEDTTIFQNFDKGDVASFHDLLCTAWALLLRCYTGQDNVSFHLRQSSADDVVSTLAVPRIRGSCFRMSFDERDSLSACFSKAKDGYGSNERTGPSAVSTVSESGSSFAADYQNTYVWIQDVNSNDTQEIAVQKVFINRASC